MNDSEVFWSIIKHGVVIDFFIVFIIACFLICRPPDHL